MGAEPEMMHVEAVDREGLRRRVKDPFYQNTTSILAMENDLIAVTLAVRWVIQRKMRKE